MAIESIVETHLDPSIKSKVEAIYSAAGVSIESVLRRVLERSVEENCIPYGLFGPNAETREAMEELRAGGGRSFSSVAELMADLNADD